MSAFAKSRTLKEQREYLPAFACREELLKVIRDNQGAYPSSRRSTLELTGRQSSSLSVRLGQARRLSWHSSCTRTGTAHMGLSAVHNLDVSQLCPSPSVSAKRWRYGPFHFCIYQLTYSLSV